MQNIILNKKVKGILEDLIVPLGTFLEKNLQTVGSNWWKNIVLNSITEDQLRNVQGRKITKISGLDLAALLRVFDRHRNWDFISQRQELLPDFRNILKEMHAVRNRWHHAGASSYPKKDIYRDLDTIQRFAKEIEADTSLLDNIAEVMEKLLGEISGPVTGRALSLHPEIKIKAVDEESYDADILSVAAGRTKDIIDRYQIHSCPDRYVYRKAKYITFRERGTGEMDALYEIKWRLIIPTNARDNLNILDQHGLSVNEVERLTGYMKENPFPENDRYYILFRVKSLIHKPRPSEVNAKTLYYSLGEI